LDENKTLVICICDTECTEMVREIWSCIINSAFLLTIDALFFLHIFQVFTQCLHYISKKLPALIDCRKIEKINQNYSYFDILGWKIEKFEENLQYHKALLDSFQMPFSDLKK